MNDTTVLIILIAAIAVGWGVWFARKRIGVNSQLGEQMRESTPTASGVLRKLFNFSRLFSWRKEEVDIDLSSREFMEWTLVWYIRSACVLYAGLVLIGMGLRYENTTLLDTADIWLIRWGWWDWKIFLPFLYAAYTVASVRAPVGPDEIGLKLVANKPVQNVYAGWVFTPLLFSRVIVTSKNLIVIQVGRIDPKRNEDGVEVEALPKDMYIASATKVPIAEPLRVTFADRSTTDEAWTTASQEQLHRHLGGPNARREELFSRVTTDPVVVIGVKIYDLRRLVQRVGTDRKEWANMLAQQAKATLSEFAGKHTVAFTIAHMHKANEKLLHDLEEQIHDPRPDTAEHKAKALEPEWKALSWGLNVEWGRISTLGLPRHINEGTAKARAEAYLQEGKKREAEASAYRIRLEGTSRAQAEEELLTAQANGRRKLGEAEAAAIAAKVAASDSPTGKVLAELETIGQALSKANLVVAPSDNIIGTFRALAEGMRASQRQEQRPPRDERGGRPEQQPQQH